MGTRTRRGLLLSAIGAAWVASGAWTLAAADCDRACLLGLTDRYVAALTTHDPAGAAVGRRQ